MKNRPLGKMSWIAAVVFILGFVYLTSGTYVYIEGDDATSIAYHVMGRNPAVQLQYSPYQGMMDQLLRFLPEEEPLLRVISFAITRIAAVIMVILILILVFDWSKAAGIKGSPAWYLLVSISALLAVPELFYFGLTYSPTMIAMTLVVLSHWMMRKSVHCAGCSKIKRGFLVGASLILFSLGVSFRWNIVTYGIVIVVDLLIMLPRSDSLKKRLVLPALWGIMALLSTMIMILLSGFDFSDLQQMINTTVYVLNQSGTVYQDSFSLESLISSLLTVSSMFTPFLLLLMAAGVVNVIRRRNPAAWLLLAGLVSVLPWLRTGVPKFLITALPLMLLALSFGLDLVRSFFTKRGPRYLVFSILTIVALAPWIIGVQVVREGSAWGPGFDLKPFTYEDIPGTSFRLSFSPGVAFPTPEGPRPMVGHGYVLLGGEWKKYVTELSDERKNSVATALQNNIPLLVTSWSPDYYLNYLVEMGFKTSDPSEQANPDGSLIERRFVNSQNQTITLFFKEIEAEDIDPFLASLKNTNLPGKVVLVGYSKTMRSIYIEHPGVLTALGRLSAVLDLSLIQ